MPDSIRYSNHYRCGEKAKDAILIVVLKRLHPIVLTTITTFAGMALTVFEMSRQARFMIPMVSLGFGILFATRVTLGLVSPF